jgi:hypothetical protein
MDNHLSHPLLTTRFKGLAELIHDRSEKVLRSYVKRVITIFT